MNQIWIKCFLDEVSDHVDDESTPAPESVEVDPASVDNAKGPEAEACVSSLFIVASEFIEPCNVAVSSAQNYHFGAAERHWTSIHPICE